MEQRKTTRRGLNRIRRAYETRKTTFLALEAEFHIPRAVISETAKAEGWVRYQDRPGGRRQAVDVEAAVMVAGLRARQPMAAAAPQPKSTRSYERHPRTMGETALTPEQERLLKVRKLFEEGGHSLNALASEFGFTSGKLYYVSKIQNWQLAPPKVLATASVKSQPASPASSSSDQPVPPVSGSKETRKKGDRITDWGEVDVAATVRMADVIKFPNASPPPPQKVQTDQLLPRMAPEERAKLRVTLAAIRAAMSVEQVQQLERHEALLLRYAHLIEVYLEPQRFVNVEGLEAEDAAEKVVTAQKAALRMLLPGDRDTLAGAIKTLTDALKTSIELKRTVAGLGKTAAVPFRPEDDLPEDAGGPLIDMEAIGTPELRVIQSAMETLSRHRRAQREPPKPPPPEPIDDLLRPATEVVKEREIPR